MSNITLPKEQTGFASDDQSLNPVQVLGMQWMDSTDHVLAISKTGTGKSTLLCMYAHKFLFPSTPTQKKKVVYIGPTKALVEEKRGEWRRADHPYKNFRKAAITSDYTAGDEELDVDSADLILTTPEAFSHRLRNRKPVSWLDDIGLLCLDEMHLLGDSSRGGHVEAILIEVCKWYPNIQVLGLSATVPNFEEVKNWVFSLAEKPCHVLTSDWRPTPLHMHFIQLKPKSKRPEDVTNARMSMTESLLLRYPDDQFLVAVFSKVFGYKLAERLAQVGIAAEFHNADKTLVERTSIENAFKSGATRVLICTSTLFAGVNLPARRVVCVSVTAGRSEDIGAAQLQQIAGRAGRPQFDDEGDVYFLLYEDFERHQTRIEQGEHVISRLKIIPNVGLHLLGNILSGRVKSYDDAVAWYKQTLAYAQFTNRDTASDKLMTQLVAALVKMRMIEETGPNRILVLKKRGKISAQMSVDPYHLDDLARNVFAYQTLQNANDTHLAAVIAKCGVYNKNPLGVHVRKKVPEECSRFFSDQAGGAIVATYMMLRGIPLPLELGSVGFTIRNDIGRVCAALNRLHTECEFWLPSTAEVLGSLPYRVLNGVSHEVGLLMAQGASKFDATALAATGIPTLPASNRTWKGAKSGKRFSPAKSRQ